MALFIPFIYMNSFCLHHLNNRSTFMHLLYHIHEELTSEDQVEPTPVEDITNYFPEQGKPRCILPIILVFYFESLFTMKLVYALSL
jgi:hypothetical protein